MKTKNNFTTDNLFKMAGIVAILIVSFSVFYYLVLFLPNRENAKLMQERLQVKQQENEKLAVEKKRQVCLDEANDSYTINWIKTSEADGVIQPVKTVSDEYTVSSDGEFKTHKKTGKKYSISEHWIWSNTKNDWVANDERAQLTRLPTDQSDSLKERRDKAKDLCLKLYPVK